MTDMLPPAVHYTQDRLHIEECALEQLAQTYQTPLFVYSHKAIVSAYKAYQKALRQQNVSVRYAVKANSNLTIIRLLKDLGSGFDVVSAGELARVRTIGTKSSQIIFYGVGKTEDEIREAIASEVGHIGIESYAEGIRVMRLATELGKKTSVLLRINPDIRATTHKHILTGSSDNKFGLAAQDALALAEKIAEHPFVHVSGAGSHIGSQLTDVRPFILAAQKVRALCEILLAKGHTLSHISIGGGFGVAYREEDGYLAPEKIPEILRVFESLPGHAERTFLIEPGRSLLGAAGVLLTRVEYVKKGSQKNFIVADCAMNDLMRPSLYGAYHRVLKVRRSKEESADAGQVYDLVGPICESGDFLAQERALGSVEEGDLLALADCGAYAMSMSSNYNSRCRAAEVLIKGERELLIRRRETLEDLLRLEELQSP